MTFTRRPLAAGATLGDRLRSLRTDANLALEDVAKQIHVTPKYLVAIEESRYRDLPGLVYARQFIRRYADALQTDVDMAMGIFEQEYTVVTRTGPASRPLLTPRVSTEFHWIRRHARFLLAGLAVTVVVVYLGLQVVQNFVPPQLTVIAPTKDITTKELSFTIRGTTDSDATVTINDQDVQTTSKGIFTEQVDLHEGLNTLNISAIKKHSSARVVTRRILVETPKQ